MDHDQGLVTYLRLAGASQEKGQFPGRDRFILLAADEAIRAGLLDVAERLRNVLIASQPHHLLARFDSFEAAEHTEDLLLLIKQVRRQCTLERAEAMVESHQLDVGAEQLPLREQIDSLVSQFQT